MLMTKDFFKRKMRATQEQQELLDNIVADIIQADKMHKVQQISVSSLSYKESGLMEAELSDSNLYISVLANRLRDITDAVEDVIYDYNHEHQNIMHVVIDVACMGDDNSDSIVVWSHDTAGITE